MTVSHNTQQFPASNHRAFFVEFHKKPIEPIIRDTSSPHFTTPRTSIGSPGGETAATDRQQLQWQLN
jgi:hypothetical protein